MPPDIQILLSGALTFGVPLALAVRELLVLDRRGPRPDPDEPRAPRPSPLPDDDLSLPPLPPCLIPSLPARRPRVLEDA